MRNLHTGVSKRLPIYDRVYGHAEELHLRGFLLEMNMANNLNAFGKNI